jgi:hypothetical protein
VLSGILRVMANVEGGDSWSKSLRSQVLEAMLELDSLSLKDMDMILCMLPGGEYDGLSAGGVALTNKDETVIVLGYSDTWQPAEKLIGTKKNVDDLGKILRGVRITPDFSGPKQQVVALFYDKNALSSSDYLLLNPAGLTAKNHLDDEKAAAETASSPLENEKVVKKLMGLLASVKDVDSQKARMTQSLILKIVVGHIEVRGKAYLDFLESLENGAIFKSFMDYLRTESKSKANNTGVVPLKWLESKVAHIRAQAMETAQSLDVESDMLVTSALTTDGEQLIVKRTDLKTKAAVRTNHYITSMVNPHRVAAKHQYQSFTKARYLTNGGG